MRSFADVGESPKAGVASTSTTNNNNFSSDEDSEDDEEDSREMTGRIYTKAGIEVTRLNSSALFPPFLWLFVMWP